MKTEKINIKGMSCMHCIKAVKDELSLLDVNLKKIEIGTVEIEYEENKVSKENLENAIRKAGYEVKE